VKRWEYTALPLDNTATGLRLKNHWIYRGDGPQWLDLDDVGDLGWEMCTVVDRPGESLPWAIFKRPVSGEQSE
jgi:hypothetical protein